MFVLSYYVYLRSVFRAVMSVTISTYIQCSVRFYLQLFAGGPMSYLRYLCFFVHSGVQHIVLCFCFVFLRLVYPMLPVSLDCPFLIATLVISNIYLQWCIVSRTYLDEITICLPLLYIEISLIMF